MARLFTINTPFYSQDYPALLTLRSAGSDISCLVRYIDKSLSNLLPDGVLIFSPAQGLKQPHELKDRQAEELVHCTIEAIVHYLHQHDS